MRIDQYPNTLQYFGLNDYLDNFGNIIRLSSKNTGSNEAKVNHALSQIEIKQGGHSYVLNRLREKLASMIFAGITDIDKVDISSIVNDIHFGVDAVARIGNQDVAIDFTEDLGAVPKKLQRANGEGAVPLIHPNSQLVYLPFLVVWISGNLICSVAQAVDNMIRGDSGICITQVQKEVRSIVLRYIKNDRMPSLLLQVHTKDVYYAPTPSDRDTCVFAQKNH